MQNHLLRKFSIPVSCFLISLLAASYFPVAEITENWFADLRVATLSQAQRQNEDIVIVTISENTLAEFPYRTPIDRGFLAGLVQELEKKGVAAIGIDLLLDQPSEQQKDRALFYQLEQLKIPVIVAYAESQDGLTQTQVEYIDSVTSDLQTGLPVVLQNPWDSVVRHVLIRRQGSEIEQLGYSAKIAQQLGIDLPDTDSLFLHFRRGPDNETGFFRSFEAHQVSLLPSDWFAGKTALIGVDLALEDRHVTPFSSVIDTELDMPGINVHAYALAQLIDGTSVLRSGKLQSSVIILLFCFFGATLFASGVSIALKVLLGISFLFGYWLGSFLVYARFEMILPIVVPSFGFLISAGTESILGWRSDQHQKRFIKNAFSKFLAPSVIDQLVQNPERLQLSGEKKEISFLFSDIAGFTSLTEKTESEVLVELLNEYLDLVCSVVLEFGGTIDKIVGDALHVFFNVPLDQTDHAKRAVDCAVALDRVCEQFRHTKMQMGIDFGLTRIGVNTGIGVVGNFGGEERFDYTAHGDAINTAARLESVNKHIGTRICVSETSATKCADIDFLPVGELVLKGKTEALKVYTPIVDGSIDLAAYKEAYNCLDLGEAKAKFEDLNKRFPNHPLVRFHYERLSSGESGTIIVMQSK